MRNSLQFIEQQAKTLMSDRTASGQHQYQIERKSNSSGLSLVRMSSGKGGGTLGSGIFLRNHENISSSEPCTSVLRNCFKASSVNLAAQPEILKLHSLAKSLIMTPTFFLTANGIVAIHDKKHQCFPYIWCPYLREAMLDSLQKGATNLLQEQQASGNIEIAGDIRCNPASGRNRQWEVSLDICHDPTAKKNASHPSCGRKRTCGRKREHTETWVDVGEFHTHPPPQNDRVCKPPSHFDVYQLIAAAHLQYHNYVATICLEGIYIIASTRKATEKTMENVVAYYKLGIHKERHTAKDIEYSINTCRMPRVELIPKWLVQLHSIMVGLFNTYHAILKNTKVTNRNTFIHRYLTAVRNVGVEATFYPAKHGTH